MAELTKKIIIKIRVVFIIRNDKEVFGVEVGCFHPELSGVLALIINGIVASAKQFLTFSNVPLNPFAAGLYGQIATGL